jgi:hypothetical protein
MFEMKEVPVDIAFAKAGKIDWLKPGVDPNTMIGASRPVFPTKHIPINVGQKPIGVPVPKQVKHDPWFYGETPDLIRLIGNAAKGFGS